VVAVVAVALLMVQRQPAVVLVLWLEQLTLVVVVVQERMVALDSLCSVFRQEQALALLVE
jgi:hypothetical protein